MKVDCPTCQRAVEWSHASPYRPFCSKRCQLIDLGEWANEEKRIASTENQDAPAQALPDVEDIEALLAKQQKGFFQE